MSFRTFANTVCNSKPILKNPPKLDFKLEAIVEKTEVLCSVNGKKYRYLIDGARLAEFKNHYSFAPGKALNFLKENCYLCERREED